VPNASPTVRHRRLGRELRRLREGAGLTIDEVATILECSDSKISRIETAHVRATPRDVRDLLNIYGITGEQQVQLVQLAREARQKGWWHQAYGDLPVRELVGLEDEATSIRTYLEQLVPGLLQTEEYARAVLRAIHPDLELEEVEHSVELRMARQQLLSRSDPPNLWAVLDEAVVRRQVGGVKVMKNQLERLVEDSALPNVTLQLLPFTLGEHTGMDGSFTIVGFPDPADRDVVYLESTANDLYLEDPKVIDRYGLLFNHLQAKALSPGESVTFFAKLAEEL
jgi:transcriptional regulator with XRE-family HTH domain